MTALYISDIHLTLKHRPTKAKDGKTMKKNKFQGYDIPVPDVSVFSPARPIVLERIITSEQYGRLLGSVLISGPALPYHIPGDLFLGFMERLLSDKT